ncbi:MAG: histone deacetylase [Phycisphaerales bacterium]|nr:histone deacetylase [Phycisphaerales bacterium]
MTRTGLLFDKRFQFHDTGPGHPERPSRLEAIERGLRDVGAFEWTTPIEPTPIDDATLLRVHTRAYLDRLRLACDSGRKHIDVLDSAICPESETIARLAAGGVISAARQVATGALTRALCIVRPPGHHAEADRSMGFCLYSNIALAARVLLDDYFTRVAVLDFDVHHGNGTQHIFDAEPRLLFCSSHEHPDYQYPGTGYAHERGVGAGEGATLNLPLMPATGDPEARAVIFETALPAIEAFRPEALLLSAGFDAHVDDPLGGLRWTDATFDAITEACVDLAERVCEGRIVSVLEGGYDLGALERCVAQHAHRLADQVR